MAATGNFPLYLLHSTVQVIRSTRPRLHQINPARICQPHVFAVYSVYHFCSQRHKEQDDRSGTYKSCAFMHSQSWPLETMRLILLGQSKRISEERGLELMTPEIMGIENHIFSIKVVEVGGGHLVTKSEHNTNRARHQAHSLGLVPSSNANNNTSAQTCPGVLSRA